MMPSLDHCVSNTSEMTTLTNTLEVFDTYKHRDDKDSDEESFHLPLDDDESDSKVQEPVRNGNGNETEDDILNKFDSTSGTLDHIDSQLEETLLNDEDEEKKEAKEKAARMATKKSESNSTQIVENGIDSDEESKDESAQESEKTDTASNENIEPIGDTNCQPEKQLSQATNLVNQSTEVALITEQEKENGGILDGTNDAKETEMDTTENSNNDATENNNVPKVDVDEELSNTVKEARAADSLKDNKNEHLNIAEIDKLNEESSKENNNPLQTSVSYKESDANEEHKNDIELKTKTQEEETALSQEDSSNDKPIEKNDDLNEPCKNNEDSEDLFDISIIRDAEEDNAESAYNEAHPDDNQTEENEEYDDRTDDKMEDDCVNDKGSNEEDDEIEEMDIDKHEDHLKSDDVDIEEANLKLECDATKDSVSDGEGENSKKTDLVQISNERKSSEETISVGKSATECRLDEVTGSLIGVDGREINVVDSLNEEHNTDNEDALKNSLKRPSTGVDGGIAKKIRTEQATDVEPKEKEKPKEKLPLRTLLSLSDFMKTRKHSNRRLTMQDLEDFCVQKICEVIVHKSELGDVHHQLKLQEQLIETMRKEIQQLTKQARDLEIVNKKLMNDLKQQTATQKPLNPLKITRSVGLQVKFTPTFEANLKRRQPNPTVSNQKGQTQTTTNRSPRVSSVVATSGNRQVVSPQKQPQVQSKPTTPLLSQALQNRRSGLPDNASKTPNQIIRIKPVDSKSGTPSASVIDLTDEDDKKDKNKNTPTKIVPSKNIAVPLRTAPMRVNATAQGIRLTTSQGKVSPITSVVTSSTPQVMYVVQSSPQNVLSPLGPKAVVVNFQSANGVLTSTLNGSAVSVIPKQGNTIQLKTVAPTKTLQNNKIVKVSNKHPAPLPPPPVVRISADKTLKPIPPKPHLTIRKTDTGIILQWKMPYELDMYEVIASYQLYAYQETSAMPSTDMWRKVGDVKALALPMACTLTQFADKNKYYFAVRPVDIHKRIGMFSEPEEISL